MENQYDAYFHDEHDTKASNNPSTHQQQPVQTDSRNKGMSRSPPPTYTSPLGPAPTRPPINYPPQQFPQQFPPQPAYHQYPQPVQAPPQHYPPGPGVNYQNGAPAMFQNGGYVTAPAQGYPQRSPYHYQQNQGTVGWSTGLFDCMDDPTNALITACCPCFTFGQVAEIVDRGHTTCATSGILYAVIAACILVPCLISCSYRTKMRSQYDLVEVPAADWITHCFCEWCALCQEYRELKNRGLDPALGWQGNLRRTQQQPQVVMMPPVNQAMPGVHGAM